MTVSQQALATFDRPAKIHGRDAEAIGWPLALSVLALGTAGLVWVHWDTAFAMYDRWVNIHSYNHAFLILPVCVYIAWERRAALRAMRPRASWLGLILVSGFGAFWMVADAADVMAGRQVALVGMIEGLALAVLGWRVCNALLFPLLYAWLAIPFDLGLLPPLQTMATAAAAWGIGLLNIPIFVEGFFIDLPSGRYWVAPGCAGLNFLLSGFALSLLYGEQMYDGWHKRVACVVIMILVAIVANWIRIFALIGAGHYLGEVYDINDHYLEGWLFFAVIVFVMMWIGLRFRDPVPDEAETPPAASVSAPRPAALAAYLGVAAGAVAIGMLFPAYAAYQRDNLPPVAQVQLAFPQTAGAWRLEDRKTDWQPAFKGADAQATARYVNGDKAVDLFIAYYAWQGNGREVVAFGNEVYDNEIWQRQRGGAVRTRVGEQTAGIAETVLRSGARRRLVWHFYWGDGRIMASPVKTKLLQAKVNLLFGDRRAGLVAASSETEDEAALADFLKSLPPITDFVKNGAGEASGN